MIYVDKQVKGAVGQVGSKPESAPEPKKTKKAPKKSAE